MRLLILEAFLVVVFYSFLKKQYFLTHSGFFQFHLFVALYLV
nr:MAG TPA: hypothetical protein [Caudoviricetes sp.]